MGEVRIIGGQFRRSKLNVPDKPGLRPTPDRVRETLFNWLGQDLTGWHVFDACAGTGVLGLEAASRGATRVQMIELDPALARSIQAAAQRLQAQAVAVTRADGIAQLRLQPPASLDLVLLDPPFASDLFTSALQAARAAVKPSAWVYLEAPRAWSDVDLADLGYALQRQLKAGQVWAHLLTPV
jgi:16S rRNA (guanine966-N2)-methyltransferase